MVYFPYFRETNTWTSAAAIFIPFFHRRGDDFRRPLSPTWVRPSNWGQIADVPSARGQGAASDSRPPFLQIISFSGRIKLSPGGAGTAQGDRGQLSLRRGTLPTHLPLLFGKKKKPFRRHYLREISRWSLSWSRVPIEGSAVGLLQGSLPCAALGSWIN